MTHLLHVAIDTSSDTGQDLAVEPAVE